MSDVGRLASAIVKLESMIMYCSEDGNEAIQKRQIEKAEKMYMLLERLVKIQSDSVDNAIKLNEASIKQIEQD